MPHADNMSKKELLDVSDRYLGFAEDAVRDGDTERAEYFLEAAKAATEQAVSKGTREIYWEAERAVLDEDSSAVVVGYASGLASAMAWDALKSGHGDTVIVLVEDEATVRKTLENAFDQVDYWGHIAVAKEEEYSL